MVMGQPPPRREVGTEINLAPPDTIEDLLKIETHSLWFENFELQLLEMMAEEKLANVIQSYDNKGELDDSHYLVVGNHFYQSFLENILGKKDDASRTLNGISTVIDGLKKDIGQESYEVLTYLLLCEKALFSYQSNNLQAAERYLNKIKQSFSPNLLTDRARATFLFMMGQFAGKRKKAERVHLLREAVELDPNNWQLHVGLYRSLRSYRREFDWGCPPYEEEARACSFGLELMDEFRLKTKPGLQAHAHVTLAMFLEEVALADLARKECFCPPELLKGLSLRERLLSSARKAAELTPNCVVTQVKFADILSHGPTVDHDECKKQYTYCLEKWPDNSRVCHKTGKFCAQSTDNADLGVEILKEGINIDKDNFPCWMDYLRYKVPIIIDSPSQTEDDWNTLLSMLEEGINHFEQRYKSVYHRKLLYAKGAILWHLGDKYAALDCWLEGFEVDTEIFDLKNQWSSKAIFKLPVRLWELLQALEDFKTIDSISESRVVLIDQLCHALQSQQRELSVYYMNKGAILSPAAGTRNGRPRTASESDANWRSDINTNHDEDPPLHERFDSKLRLDENGNQPRRLNSGPSSLGKYIPPNLRSNNNPTQRDLNTRGGYRKQSESDLDDNWRN